MNYLRSALFLWLANHIPDFYALRIIKAALLSFAGIKLNILGLYFISSLYIDRPSRVTFGKGVFVNRNCTLEGLGYITIGSNVQIGPNVVLATTNHNLVNMHVVSGDINILDNVWLGANVVVTQGVRLGPNVVVGAGAVVTSSFSDCSVSGVPATVMKATNPKTMSCCPKSDH